MHPPSPQLLRALRSSIQANSRLSSSCRASSSCQARLASPVSLTPRRSNSNSYPARPPRILPRAQPPKPQTRDRGPRSSETTQTDFAALDVLGNLPTPATAVDACLDDGFHLDNGIKVTGGDGVLLVGGEAFTWRPWQAFDHGGADAKSMMVNEKGQFEVAEEVWGLLGLVWPRPGEFCPLNNRIYFSTGLRLIIIVRLCRPSDPRPGVVCVPCVARDEAAYQLAGHSDRGSGHQERGSTVQPARNRTRCHRGCRSHDPHWVERTVVRAVLQLVDCTIRRVLRMARAAVYGDTLFSPQSGGHGLIN